ncbi:Modulator of FtsH protease HflC [Limihaloglobus sulfuriphilus]|uniref:Protein HflC n=1 Tax=Limihaloglobus sulfuriphilus TaxID=1851148 RepID=A0A1Q2MH00_9BACT|nr:protease modulator HflC [Limihaloglobus sulfuriphilus]AQQ71929.1 Modulator of FtsH protease HflC [Limihaloglobus sulfuriphilus]
MKNLFVTILLIIIVIVLGLKFCFYQVRETESVLITRFGEPVAEKVDPGLYIKWPSPIEKVHRFDSRLQLFEGQMEETTTKGGEPVVVTSYIAWRIAEPQKFFERVSTVNDVQKFLMSQLRNEQNEVIGRHYFSEFINTDPEKINFEGIENELRQSLGSELSDKYGITVAMVGIKKFEINEEVTAEVFNRMKADRNRKTETILGVGNATATKIRTDAESKKTELLAAANARAKAIMGRGDAEAARYYKMLEEDPELAMFLRDIEALKVMLEKDTTIVLGADTQPIGLLKDVPDIAPEKGEKETSAE